MPLTHDDKRVPALKLLQSIAMSWLKQLEAVIEHAKKHDAVPLTTVRLTKAQIKDLEKGLTALADVLKEAAVTYGEPL